MARGNNIEGSNSSPSAVAHATSKLSMKAIAIRNIAPGEEIVISCTESPPAKFGILQLTSCADIRMGLPSGARAQALAQAWGFTCNCPLCSAPKKEKAESDRRRERLSELTSIMTDDTTTYQQLVTFTQEALDIVERERLMTTSVELYVMLMNLYYGRGNLESAIKYGKLGMEIMELFEEPDSELMKEARENLEWLELEKGRV